MSRRLSALDALGRGAGNLRGNHELVWIQLAGSLALVAVILVGVLAMFAAFGVPASLLAGDRPEALREALQALPDDLGSLPRRFGSALLVLLVTSTVAFLAFCWYQAGTLAVLVAGEAQAPLARGVTGAVFRTFSWSAFSGWSTRYFLRLFWLLNLFLLFMLLALLGLLLPLLFLPSLAEARGGGAACLVGCGAALPFLFVLSVVAIAMTVAQVRVVEEPCGVFAAARSGFAIAGRRLGALVLLYLLMLLASLALALLVGGLGVTAELALAGSAWKALPAVALSILQMVTSAALSLLYLAAVVALVRAERRLEAAPA